MFAALAARLAPALVRYRWLILLLWVLLMLAGAFAAGRLDHLVSEEDGARNSSAWRANHVLREKFQLNTLTELALIFEQAPDASASDAERFRAQASAAVRSLSVVADVRPIPLPAEAKGLAVSHLALKAGVSDDGSVQAVKDLKLKLEALRAPPGVQVRLMGRPVVMQELRMLNSREVARIESISLVISLVVLVLVFGSFVSALLPLVVGIASLLATMGLLVALGGLVPVVTLTRMIAGIIAIAVGIDYALFVVSRYREARARGEAIEGALQEALSHTGEAIFFSGLIMIISVAALAIPDQSATRAVAGAVVLVVVISLVASFTLLPALLAILDRVLDAPRAFARLRWGNNEAFWAGFSRWMLARYKPFLALTAAGVLLLLFQLGHLRMWEPGPTLLPEELPSRQAYDALARAGLTGELDAFYVVVHQAPGPHLLASATLHAMERLAATMAADARIRRVDSLVTLHDGWMPERYDRLYAQLDNPLLRPLLLRRLSLALHQDADGTYTVMRVVPRQGMTSPAVCDLVKDLQRKLAAQPLPAGLSWDLGGDMPRRVAFSDEIYGKFPLVIGGVVLSIYGLLFLYFRSLLLPLKAVLMNLIPVFGGCAVLVLVLQDGFGAGLIGVSPAPGAIMAMTPLMLFCLIFGLSMDYEVLILSRIQEAHNAGLDDATAILEGMTRTSGVITGAALIMLSVFAPNIFSALINSKELGLGLSAAIVLDATAVRLVLVPTLMRAMGSWNWYCPAFLARRTEQAAPAQAFDQAA